MSAEEPVEQITKEPEKVEKVKDPKKVAAGKRLAEYHKKAKKALEGTSEEKSWMPEISFTTALSIAGIALTTADLYYRWKSSSERKSSPEIKYVENEPAKKRIGME